MTKSIKQSSQTKTVILSIHRRQQPGHDYLPLTFTVGLPAMPDDTIVVERITSINAAGKYAHSLQPSYIVHFEGSDVKRSIPASEVIDVAYQLVAEEDEPAMPTIVEANSMEATSEQ